MGESKFQDQREGHRVAVRNECDESAGSWKDEIAELEDRLYELAEHLLERSRVPGPDAIDLHEQGTALRRAAFVLHSVPLTIS